MASKPGRPRLPQPIPRWDEATASGSDSWATEHESRADIIGVYHRVWTHTDATIHKFPLEARGFVAWWGEEVPLFNVMVHCLSDTTRHAGHADILREGLDGAGVWTPPACSRQGLTVCGQFAAQRSNVRHGPHQSGRPRTTCDSRPVHCPPTPASVL